MSRLEFPANVDCPCCRQKVAAPSLEIVIDACKVSPQGAKILEAVWKGRGHPVPTKRILDKLWEHDPDGGPSEHRMSRNFQWSLSQLRTALKGSGWAIENVFYNCGYRLSVEQAGDE